MLSDSNPFLSQTCLRGVCICAYWVSLSVLGGPFVLNEVRLHNIEHLRQESHDESDDQLSIGLSCGAWACVHKDSPNMTFTQIEEEPMPQPPSIPAPNDNGDYTCDICHQKVHVGGGGPKNFMQHRSSPGCLRTAEKIKKSIQANQAKAKTITSFFPKITSTVKSSTPAMRPHPIPFASSPICLSNSQQPGLATMQSVTAKASACSDAHAMALLAQLDNAALHLLSHILEAAESDDIAWVEP